MSGSMHINRWATPVVVLVLLMGVGCKPIALPKEVTTPLRENLLDTRGDVESTYTELEQIAKTPAAELEKQYKAYQKSADDMRQQIAKYEAEVKKIETKADDAIADFEDGTAGDIGFWAKLLSIFLGDPIENLKESKEDLFNQVYAVYRELEPLVDELDREAAGLKAKLDSGVIKPGTDPALKELESAKLSVDEALNEVDESIKTIDANSDTEASASGS